MAQSREVADGAADIGGEVERLARRITDLRQRPEAAAPVEADRLFAHLDAMLRPLNRRLIRRYGLMDMPEDAAQACAIGIHRALDSFDPSKARFATHATWQIRGELQSLRHRVRLDQRRSAVSAKIITVSLESLLGPDQELPFEIVDESAEARTERGASDNMVHAMLDQLLDRLGSPEDERAVMHDTVFDREPSKEASRMRTAEQRRQIVRRTWRNCIKVLAA